MGIDFWAHVKHHRIGSTVHRCWCAVSRLDWWHRVRFRTSLAWRPANETGIGCFVKVIKAIPKEWWKDRRQQAFAISLSTLWRPTWHATWLAAVKKDVETNGADVCSNIFENDSTNRNENNTKKWHSFSMFVREWTNHKSGKLFLN